MRARNYLVYLFPHNDYYLAELGEYDPVHMKRKALTLSIKSEKCFFIVVFEKIPNKIHFGCFLVRTFLGLRVLCMTEKLPLEANFLLIS